MQKVALFSAQGICKGVPVKHFYPHHNKVGLLFKIQVLSSCALSFLSMIIISLPETDLLKRNSRWPNEYRSYLLMVVMVKCERNVNVFAHYSLDFTSNLHSNYLFMEKLIPDIYYSSSNLPIQWEIQLNSGVFLRKFHKLSRFIYVYSSPFCSDQAHSTGVSCTLQISCQYYKVIAQPSRINSVQA